MRDDIGMPGPCGAEDHQDELPLLLHGTLAPARRAALEAHVAVCAACAADLALLRRADRAMRGAVPAIDVAAIAAGVRAATIAGAPSGAEAPALRVVRGDAAPAAPSPAARPPAHATRPTWATGWPARIAATLLVTAMGTGALVLGRGTATGPAGGAPAGGVVADGPVASLPPAVLPGASTIVVAERDVASADPGTAARGARPADGRSLPGGSLGVALDDLSEEEVGAVLDALDEPDAWRPVAEPLPMVPTPGEEGGL